MLLRNEDSDHWSIFLSVAKQGRQEPRFALPVAKDGFLTSGR